MSRATDADEGPNAAIRYAIIGGNLQGQFSIDSQSGEVSLMKPLDYENTRSFRLNIRAQGADSSFTKCRICRQGIKADNYV